MTPDPRDEPTLEVDEDESAEHAPSGPGLARAPLPRSITERHLKTVVESLVFVADKPITVQDLARVARADARDVRKLLHELRDEYQSRGIQLDEVAGAWQFRSSVANAPFVRELLQAKPVRLTRAQVESLSIIAYRQPITRPEIDEIRGVDSGSALKVLLDRNLVRHIGRREEPGRPLLYGTTSHFLEFFGLRALKDLPMLREYTELSPESEATLTERLAEGEAPATKEAPPGDEGGDAR